MRDAETLGHEINGPVLDEIGLLVDASIKATLNTDRHLCGSLLGRLFDHRLLLSLLLGLDGPSLLQIESVARAEVVLLEVFGPVREEGGEVDKDAFGAFGVVEGKNALVLVDVSSVVRDDESGGELLDGLQSGSVHVVCWCCLLVFVLLLEERKTKNDVMFRLTHKQNIQTHIPFLISLHSSFLFIS